MLPKVSNPLKIKLGKDKKTLIFSNGDILDLEKSSGCMFGGASQHFGFEIEVECEDGSFDSYLYLTQEQISAVELERGKIKVWEENKYPYSWIINEDGTVATENNRLCCAEYYKTWGPTREHIANNMDKYGAVGQKLGVGGNIIASRRVDLPNSSLDPTAWLSGDPIEGIIENLNSEPKLVLKRSSNQPPVMTDLKNPNAKYELNMQTSCAGGTTLLFDMV